MSKQTKRKLLTFTSTPQIEEMLQELEVRLGESRATVIRQGIQLLHGKTFKDYIEVQKARAKLAKDLSPEAKATMDLQKQDIKKEAKAKKIYNEGLRICELLEGEHIKENGWDLCKFECHEYMNPNYVHSGFMTLPFDELSEELLEIKWKGGREKIEEVWAKQKSKK